MNLFAIGDLHLSFRRVWISPWASTADPGTPPTDCRSSGKTDWRRQSCYCQAISPGACTWGGDQMLWIAGLPGKRSI